MVVNVNHILLSNETSGLAVVIDFMCQREAEIVTAGSTKGSWLYFFVKIF